MPGGAGQLFCPNGGQNVDSGGKRPKWRLRDARVGAGVKVGEAERNLRCYGGSEKWGKLGPHCSVKSKETLNLCRSPLVPRGASVVAPRHPQNRTGMYESTLISQEGPEYQGNLHGWEEAPHDQRAKSAVNTEGQRPPP